MEKLTLTLLFETVYPIYLKQTVVHFKDIKRKLMRMLSLNRWEFDYELFQLHRETFDGQTYAFYPGSCGWHPGSRLNFVSRAKKGEAPNRRNSYCFISFDKRNTFVQRLREGE